MSTSSTRGFVIGAVLASVLTLGSVAISNDDVGSTENMGHMDMMSTMHQMMQGCMSMMADAKD